MLTQVGVLNAYINPAWAVHAAQLYLTNLNMLATSILALLSGLYTVSAQSFTETSFVESVVPFFPTGVVTGTSQIESGFPLACVPGCQSVSQFY